MAQHAVDDVACTILQSLVRGWGFGPAAAAAVAAAARRHR